MNGATLGDLFSSSQMLRSCTLLGSILLMIRRYETAARGDCCSAFYMMVAAYIPAMLTSAFGYTVGVLGRASSHHLMLVFDLHDES